ncbi:MAG: hypothetical protein WAO07_03905, partial [Desulfobacterales bacterium]
MIKTPVGIAIATATGHGFLEKTPSGFDPQAKYEYDSGTIVFQVWTPFSAACRVAGLDPSRQSRRHGFKK